MNIFSFYFSKLPFFASVTGPLRLAVAEGHHNCDGPSGLGPPQLWWPQRQGATTIVVAPAAGGFSGQGPPQLWWPLAAGATTNVEALGAGSPTIVVARGPWALGPSIVVSPGRWAHHNCGVVAPAARSHHNCGDPWLINDRKKSDAKDSVM